MGITGLISESVVYDYLVSIAEELELHALDHTISCSIDRIPWLEGKIDSSMSCDTSADRVRPVAETA